MSCLFQSLSSFVTHQDYSKLRQDICNFLAKNPKLLGDIDLKTIAEIDQTNIEDYVKNMRNNATWGGAIEIRAFCEMYKVNVLVKNIRNNSTDENHPKNIQFLCSDPTSRWVFISWNGGHFEPVIVHIKDDPLFSHSEL